VDKEVVNSRPRSSTRSSLGSFI